MLLPSVDVQVDVPLSPVLQDARQRKAVDKALVEKAVTIRIVESLPQVLDHALDLATSAESESVQADMTKYLLDRVAGKSVDRVQSTNINVNATFEEMEKRLNHLNFSDENA